MNKETMNENNKVDQVFNNLADNFIKILNEAVEKERSKTEHWKRKAYVLANKYGTCPQHDQFAEDRPFKLNEYLEIVDCLDCPDDGTKITAQRLKEEEQRANHKETLYCWKCAVKVKAGHVCFKCAGIDENKGIHAEAINTVMESVLKTQEKQIERMKQQQQENKSESSEDLIGGTFGEFAKSELKKVECVECKEYRELSQCNYDYATNRYTCKICVERLQREAEQEKERKTTETINRIENKNSQE